VSATAPPAATAQVDRRWPAVTLPRVVRSEWTKLRTLRSTRWSLLAAVIGMAGLGPAVAAVQMSRWAQLGAEERSHFDAIDAGVGGYHLAQLAIGVLGVLVITGEYSTGMIRSSFMAVPRRLPVLWAKLLVFSAVTFALMLVSTVVSFYAVQAIVTQHHQQVSLGAPHALRAVIGTALFLTVLGILAVGLGTLVRNTAGGIASFVGLLFVLPGVVALLPSTTADHVNPYLPLNAAFAVATSRFDDRHHLAPWTGFGVFTAYALVVVIVAAVGLLRRDA
jgi:ABC-type transport system involved in multi-copper enzyme maturation permease subunit